MPAITPARQKYDLDRKHYPSVLKQGLEAQFFNFGKAEAPGVSYFNPTLVQRPDGLWLVTRRSESKRHLRIGMNSLMAFRLDENKIPAVGYRINCKSLFDGEHYEDPRTIQLNSGNTLVSCCNFIVYPSEVREKWTGAHICLQVCNEKWQSQQRIDPVYGSNTNSLSTVMGLEKNWLWFMHNKELHLLYSAQPQTVVRWAGDFKPVEEWKDEASIAAWAYGDIRGGTPPLFHDGLYWTFFHSSLPINNKYRRRYYMGAYAFEPFAPFKIVKFTREPILAGSDEDPWADRKPLVVFPCGAVIENNTWFVSLGINDLYSAWVKVPHTELLFKMGERKRSLTKWVTDKLTATSDGVVAYLPPPNVGHTSVFLKNLKEHPPTGKVLFLSDYPWPDSERIPDPTQHFTNKDQIAAFVFIKALELAEQKGLDNFIYLETDCRVAGKGWDKLLFKRFYAAGNGTIAAGNIAVFGSQNGDETFKRRLMTLVGEHGMCWHDQSSDKSAILFQGIPSDKTIPFVNGAPAVYSVKALRGILGYGTAEMIASTMKTSDLDIGEMYAQNHGVASALAHFEHVPEIMATGGETIYPFAARTNALHSGQAVAVHPIKNRWRPRPTGTPSFYHCGDLGDIIYSLKAIKLYGGGRLVLGNKCYSKFPPRSPMSREVFKLFQPLLDQQQYLTSVAFAEHWDEWDYDLNDFREMWNTRPLDRGPQTLCEMHCAFIGVEPLFTPEPWLTAEVKKLAKIIVHRSARYRNDKFPWAEIVEKYHKQIVFVGLKEEHVDFINQFGRVAFFRPENFADMAAFVNGAEWVICNQSFPGSLALGLGKRVWQETWEPSPDCVFKRSNFFNSLTFPEGL